MYVLTRVNYVNVECSLKKIIIYTHFIIIIHIHLYRVLYFVDDKIYTYNVNDFFKRINYLLIEYT